MTCSLPPGFRAGHWTDPDGMTGCTVVLCPDRTVGGCDVRGSSPSSRELALLESERSMQEVHAVLLTGGSAFGLAAADGVMRFLEEHGTGYRTPWARVPIVPAAVIYDLNTGSSAVRPTAESGYAACSAAASTIGSGRYGAGTGATVGKWNGIAQAMPGGLGVATGRLGEIEIAAIAVVNAIGDIYGADGTILAGAREAGGGWAVQEKGAALRMPLDPEPVNTTLVALLTNARLTKVEANRLAARGHDGMARAIKPVHTSHDGDLIFALASGTHQGMFDAIAEMAADLTAEAIRNAVRPAAAR